MHFPTGLCCTLQTHSQKANAQTISCSLELAVSFTKKEQNWGAQSTIVLLLINVFTQSASHWGPEQVLLLSTAMTQPLAQRGWGAAQKPGLCHWTALLSQDLTSFSGRRLYLLRFAKR